HTLSSASLCVPLPLLLSPWRHTLSMAFSLCPSPTLPLSPSLPLSFRSEEHTSELQSHLNIVCRILLEKKTITMSKPYYASLGISHTHHDIHTHTHTDTHIHTHTRAHTHPHTHTHTFTQINARTLNHTLLPKTPLSR